MWYHKSRGVQVLTPLFAFNCPTFLFTQKQWKLFVENDDRDQIFTFPFSNDDNLTSHVNSSLVHLTGNTLLMAIAICLLSNRTAIVEAAKNSKKTKESVASTPKANIVKPKFHDTAEKCVEKQPRRSSRSSQYPSDNSLLLYLGMLMENQCILLFVFFPMKM